MSQEQWKPLKPKGLSGPADKIATVALSDHAVLRTVKSNLRRFSRQCGVGYVVGQHISDSIDNYSASDEQKIADLRLVMKDPSVRIVTCATGGYSIAGFLRRNEDVVRSLFEANPKLWMGFSDAGALSMFLLAQLNLVSASSPNMWGLYSDWDEQSRLRLQHVIFGETTSLYLDHSWVPMREGDAEGVIITANLGTLCRALGTVSDPLIGLSRKDLPVILIAETFSTTLDEVAADLDQLFHQREQARISAFVLGGRTPGMFAGVYREFFQNNGLTDIISRGLPSEIPWGIYHGYGHSEAGSYSGYKPKSNANRFMETIPFGVWGKISLGDNCHLEYDCPVVV